MAGAGEELEVLDVLSLPVTEVAAAPRRHAAVPGLSVATVLLLLAAVAAAVLVRPSGGAVLEGVNPAAAIGRAVDQGTAEPFQFKLHETIDGLGQNVTLGFDGRIDPVRGLADLQATQPKAVRGLHLVQDQLAIYATRDGKLIGGKPWGKATVTGVDAAAAIGADAKGALEQLRGVATVTDLGTTTIDGVAVRHYHGDVDTAASLARAGSAAPAGAASVARQVPTIPIEMYLDASGRVRRTTTKLSVSGVTTEATNDFSHYGEAVVITVPAPDQVTDFGPEVQEMLAALR